MQINYSYFLVPLDNNSFIITIFDSYIPFFLHILRILYFIYFCNNCYVSNPIISFFYDVKNCYVSNPIISFFYGAKNHTRVGCIHVKRMQPTCELKISHSIVYNSQDNIGLAKGISPEIIQEQVNEFKSPTCMKENIYTHPKKYSSFSCSQIGVYFSSMLLKCFFFNVLYLIF